MGQSAARRGDVDHDAATPRETAALYPRVVDQIRDGGLTVAELARVLGVAERQVRNWSSGANKPSGARRDALLQVQYVIQLLRDVYTREGAEIWLHGRKRSLQGRRPVDLLAEGAYDEVLAAIERLQAGAM